LTTPANVAETVTDWPALTVPAFAITAPDAEPAAIVSDVGTVNTALFVDIATTMDTGAIALSVIVQVVLPPEEMDDGEHEIPASDAVTGETVTVVLADAEFAAAVITAAWLVVTSAALAMNVC